MRRMLTVEEYGRVRRAQRDGMSIRAIAGRRHHSRRKIREILTHPDWHPFELGHHIAQQGDAASPLLDHDLVFLSQFVAKEAVMDGPLGITQDLGNLRGGISDILESLKNLLGAGFDGAVLVAADCLRHRALDRHLTAGLPVDRRSNFIIGANAEPAGQLVPV